MPRQLPSNRRPLRLTALGLIPVYLVLWIAGTGCYGSLYMENARLARCLFVLDLLLETGVSQADLVAVTFGIQFTVLESTLTSSGSSSSEGEGLLTIRHQRAGDILADYDVGLRMAAGGLIDDRELFKGGLQLVAGDQLTLLLALDQAVKDLFATVGLEENAMRVPSFRFPDTASRVKFTTAFDAEFGVPYDFVEGELVIDGSAVVSEEARARAPKKVIVEVAHLDANGKVKSRHKQIVKIKKTGDFKTSRKAFKGFDVAAGERVRVRLKPKRGDLVGVDWTLLPTYNFVR